jgi:hypothetical protein
MAYTYNESPHPNFIGEILKIALALLLAAPSSPKLSIAANRSVSPSSDDQPDRFHEPNALDPNRGKGHWLAA